MNKLQSIQNIQNDQQAQSVIAAINTISEYCQSHHCNHHCIFYSYLLEDNCCYLRPELSLLPSLLSNQIELKLKKLRGKSYASTTNMHES